MNRLKRIEGPIEGATKIILYTFATIFVFLFGLAVGLIMSTEII